MTRTSEINRAMMERVPRYTSYPTAPHFHEGIDAKTYREWLKALGREEHRLSLYFHVPYCEQLCWFCGCHTRVVNHYAPVETYLSLLEQEISLVAHELSTLAVTHIHFGGGSPTIVKAQDFVSLMNKIRQNFSLSEEVDIAVEIDPRTVDEEKVAAYAATGVTRTSLGVQDFTPEVQAAINRIQPYEMVQDVVRMLRGQGIHALNMDLIYGLPYQSLRTTRETIEKTLTLEPDRISLFGYAHVPWMKKHQQLVPQEALPEPAERLEMFEAASCMLLDAGYVSIGLDHFAKPDDSLAKALRDGELHRNFQGYTTDKADVLLGLGVSSISSLPQGYVQTTSNNIDYAKTIQSGGLPVARGIALTEEDKERRAIIMSLMCHMRVPLSADRYGAELERLEPHIKAGDVLYDGRVLTINPKAQKHLRLIVSVFDSYLSGSAHRYSQAV